MGFQKLPFELVTAAFDYLPQKDRRAASVSRMLYSAAQEAGLYIHQRIHLHNEQTAPHAVKDFIALVDYAALKTNGPGLPLTIACRDWNIDSAKIKDSVRSLLPAIRAALPFLVHLRVCVPADCCSALYEALCVPAPGLRVLALCQNHDSSEDWIPLPQNLFAGCARRLHEVYLSAPSLDIAFQEPVPAFRHVRRANIRMTSVDAHLQTAQFFPNVRALWIRVEVPKWALEYSEPVVDLTGLHLRHLSILDELVGCVRSETPLRKMRYVEQMGSLPWDKTLWPEDAAAGDFYAHFLGYGCSMRFSFGPLSGEWTRALSPWGHDRPDQALLKSLSLVGARLGTLTLHSEHVLVFLECKMTLGALAELIIDLGPDSDGSYHSDVLRNLSGDPCKGVHCPALRTLSLLAADAGVESRSDGDGTVLQLIGVQFASHLQREPILRIFAGVHEGLAFFGQIAEQYYRGAGESGDINVNRSAFFN